jgi:hypothetical protein
MALKRAGGFFLSLKEETSPVPGDTGQDPGDRPSTAYRPPTTESRSGYLRSGWLGGVRPGHTFLRSALPVLLFEFRQ